MQGDLQAMKNSKIKGLLLVNKSSQKEALRFKHQSIPRFSQIKFQSKKLLHVSILTLVITRPWQAHTCSKIATLSKISWTIFHFSSKWAQVKELQGIRKVLGFVHKELKREFKIWNPHKSLLNLEKKSYPNLEIKIRTQAIPKIKGIHKKCGRATYSPTSGFYYFLGLPSPHSPLPH